eukprot:1151437-Pelagomonas_calceolata.AAC.3
MSHAFIVVHGSLAWISYSNNRQQEAMQSVFVIVNTVFLAWISYSSNRQQEAMQCVCHLQFSSVDSQRISTSQRDCLCIDGGLVRFNKEGRSSVKKGSEEGQRVPSTAFRGFLGQLLNPLDLTLVFSLAQA